MPTASDRANGNANGGLSIMLKPPRDPRPTDGKSATETPRSANGRHPPCATAAAVATEDDSEIIGIRKLNDVFRQTFEGGSIVMTSQFRELPVPVQEKAIEAIKSFNAFTPEYDTYREHDLVNVRIDGIGIYAKIDYYDNQMAYPSEDPSDPAATMRVMTIMLSTEF